MVSTVAPRPELEPAGLGGTRLTVTVVLALWLVLVVALGSVGSFEAAPGKPPLPLLMGVAVPLTIFFAWLRLSNSFRDFVLGLDLRLVAGIQAWRWAGLGFLSLYAYHVLPAPFALTAGLGDMAIGFTAPWIILALARQPAFAGSAAFVRWNLAGILDLVVALSIGALTGILASGAPGEITTAPMQSLPLILIPAFLVPVFLMLHTAALMQSRQVARRRA